MSGTMSGNVRTVLEARLAIQHHKRDLGLWWIPCNCKGLGHALGQAG